MLRTCEKAQSFSIMQQYSRMALLRSNAQMEMGKDKSFLALAAATMPPPRAMCRAATIKSRRARPSHRADAAVSAISAFYRGSPDCRNFVLPWNHTISKLYYARISTKYVYVK